MTANLYCEGLQDAALHGALALFEARLRAGDPDRAGFLWIVRYPRNGEHLKVRVHASAEQEPCLRERLREAVDAWLATLPPVDPERPRKDAPGLPAIDPEDEVTTPWPDRTLLWTRYRRSHISLGGGPFLADDGYVARLTSCLGTGCTIVLDALVPDSAGRISDSLRQTTLLRLLIGGLAVVGLGEEERAAYLAYHRDWLVRFSLKGGGDAERTRELLARFDQRAEQMGASLGALRDAAQNAREDAWGEPRDRGDRWQQTLAELAGYAARFRGNPGYRLDPFSENPVFTPLFKVFHGMANQLGLGMLPEALTHHLLLRATA